MPPESLRSPRLRDTLFEFVTGRQAPAKALGNIAAMLRTTYGASARNPERPDLKAAAAGLGMSVRQLQRWVRGETTPRADNPRLQKLRRQTSAVVNTKRGRKQALRNAASARPPSAPKITVTGVQGRRSDNLEQYRPRSCSTTLSDEEFNTFQDLWAEHGPAGAADWLHAHFDANYLADWHFLDIDEIKWSD